MSSFSPRRGDRGSTIVLNSARTASNRDTLQRALQTTFDESDIDALRQIRHDIDEKICALEARATGLRGAAKWRELTLNHHAHFGPAFSCFAQRTLAAARGAELAERVTDSEQARGAMRLILGTINFLGDDANPWQFQPPDRECARIEGGPATWSMSLKRATAVFSGVTVADALDALDAAAKACAGDGAAAGDLAARARAWSAGLGAGAEKGDGAATVLALMRTGVLDVGLDNKWAAEEGRYNPIVYGLAALPDAPSSPPPLVKHARSSTVPVARTEPAPAARGSSARGLSEGDERAVAPHTQMDLARADADDFARRVVRAYVAYEERRSGGASAGEKQAHLLFSLLLWDLACTLTVARAGLAMKHLAGASYLVDAPGSRAARAMVKVAQGRKLGALLRPVRLLSEAHPHAAVVLACQEMPPTRGDIPVPIGMSLGRNRAPGSSAADEEEAPDADADAGFITRNVEYEPVTERVRASLAKAFDLAEAERGAVDAKVRATSLRKLAVGLFHSYSCARPFACINLHCKNFKKAAATQAAFVVHAQRLVSEQLTAEEHDRPAVIAGCACVPKATTPIPVFVAGDTNIDSKFAKGLGADAQLAALKAAPCGRLPSDAVDFSLLKQFADVLTNAGAEFFPPLDMLTTIKQRTLFQGQAEKAGELTVAHKEFIVAPPRSPDAAAAFEVRDTRIVPDPNANSSNLDLLMPSKEWPGDHSTVMCMIEFAE